MAFPFNLKLNQSLREGGESEEEGERSLENHGHLLTSVNAGVSELGQALRTLPGPCTPPHGIAALHSCPLPS